jgi:hypothetical protein
VCRVCCAGVEPRFTTCASCTELRRRLGMPLLPVLPVSLAAAGGPLYRALRLYKTAHPEAADLRRRLGALLAAFFGAHLPCAAPEGIDLVTVVPSSWGRPAPHPLAGVLGAVPSLPVAGHVLSAAPGSVGHRSPSADMAAVVAPVAGRRVLLVDDTYTTGARLQSAARALAGAGASSVRAVVVGRFVRPGWPPTQGLLEWAARHPWHEGACARCAAGGMRRRGPPAREYGAPPTSEKAGTWRPKTSRPGR